MTTLLLPIILLCVAAILIIWLARLEDDHPEDAPLDNEWPWPWK